VDCRCLMTSLLSVARSAYYQLRQLRTVARSLSYDAAKTLDSKRYFVSTGLLQHTICGISDGLIQRLQSAGHRNHITPVLTQLHWLPARHRIEFEVAVLESQVSSRPHRVIHVRRLSTSDGDGTPVSGRLHLCSPSDTDTAEE